ncbi:MAG: tetratricopeptide repeat protein [Elusimicrobiota bacterium]
MKSRTYLLTLFLFIPSLTRGFDSVQLKQSITAPAGLKAFSPKAIAVDNVGRFWVCDSANHQIHGYSAAGEWVRTLGRQGVLPGEFQNPRGVAVDAEGFLYVADAGNARIQIFTPEGKLQSVFGQRGSDVGQFRSPWHIAVSRDEVILVADKDASRVQLFSKDGIFYHAFDVGAPIDGLTVDVAGHLYVSHVKTKEVEQWSSAGQLLHTFNSLEPGVKPFNKPMALTTNVSGLLYVADTGANRVRELDPKGRTIGMFGRPGSGEGQFRAIEGLATANDLLFVCDSKNRRVLLLALSRQTSLPALTPVAAARLQVSRKPSLPIDTDRLAWNPDGALHTLSFSRNEIVTYDLTRNTTASINLKTELAVKTPSGLTTAPASGALFISDRGNDRVIKIDRQGKLLKEFGKEELSNPQGLACSTQGVLFVANTGNSRFDAFNHQGLFQFSGGEKGSERSQMKTPVSIAWDKDRLYVADPGNRKIVAFNASGRYLFELGLAGPEVLEDPRQVAVDREGNLFVLDAERGRLLAYDPQGVYLGGFGSLGKAEGFLNHPRSFALNDIGELYIAEEGRVQAFHMRLLPPAPAGLSATAGEGYVSLKWDPVKTRFPARYIVYRSTPLGEPQKIKETVDTSVTDDALSANTTYTYTIAAQSVQGATSVPSASIAVSARALSSGPRLEILSTQIEDVFSAHYKYYSRVPLGTVVIRNNGESPMRKIKVSFAIQGYMDYPSETAIAELRSLEEKQIPLPATFNNRILEVTETTPIQAQVKVTYYNGDQELSVTRNLPFKLYSRNTIRWDKKDRFAAFVTPNDPPVIDFARAIATSFAEAHRGAPVPSAIMTAWSVFEGLGTYGISYLPRPHNPYDRVSLDSSTVDSMQFARETLARKSGDCSDVVALLASALESLTVTTCALDAPGHLFLMFDTGENQKEALGFPEGWVVPYGGTYWVPVEATMIGSPFLDAWKQGAEQYRRWSQQGKVTPLDIHLAWRQFEPATLPEIASGVKAPTRQAIEEKFLADWKSLIDLRWQTSLSAAKQATTGTPNSGEPWLRLGFLATEFRHYQEARQYFLKARDDAATAASSYNNLGNLAMIQGDLVASENYYKQALEKDAGDAQVSINLARLYLKTGHPKKASTAFEKAMSLDPGLREQYPDVSVLAP